MRRAATTTEVLVSRSAILHNLALFEKAAGMPVAPVIKSNAYGHGLTLVGAVLDRTKAPFLCVNSADEAKALRAAGVKKPLLVIGYTPVRIIRADAIPRCSYMVGALDDLRALKGSKASIHLKLDTGMHRHGIRTEDTGAAIRLIRGGRLKAEGIFSHLADADGINDDFTLAQIAAWNSSAAQLREALPELRWRHLAATTGIRLNALMDVNVARLGVGLYGMNASHEKLPLKPALEMRSVLSSVRALRPGEKIGYNGRFSAKKAMRAASVPAGYFEGVDRRLTNKGCFLVRGKACPILGRVSMNITSVDVSALPRAKAGDEITVISANPEAPNSVENIAAACGTIPYEILVHVSPLLPRRLV